MIMKFHVLTLFNLRLDHINSSLKKKLKKPVPNSDGLIKCLPSAQDKFVTSSKIYARKLCIIYKVLWHPDSFISRDSIVGLVGRRSGALFFARHQDYFIGTCNFTAIYQDLVPFPSFTVTRNFLPSTRTGKKTGHRDADGT
jgi:hypothetical protein